MKVQIKRDVTRVKYKSHIIRKVEDQFGNEFVLIDNESNEVEKAPAFMRVDEFTYPSIADAKRNINGEQMIWVCEEAEFRPEYFTRFLIKIYAKN